MPSRAFSFLALRVWGPLDDDLEGFPAPCGLIGLEIRLRERPGALPR